MSGAETPALGLVVEPLVVVGVTGHRKLDRATAKRAAGEVLDRLASLRFAGQSPRLRVISPLAEGADRAVARAALERRIELQCPLPLARADYAKDFAQPASRKEYETLLGAATRVFELAGDPDDRPGAYREVGRLVVQHCDLLIAIWDGRPSRGAGGTAEVVDLALQAKVPVVWIDADGREGPALLGGSVDRPERLSIDGLEALLAGAVAPPRPSDGGVVSWSAFLQERRPAVAFPGAFKAFVNLVLFRMPRGRGPAADWLAPSARDWRQVYEAHAELAAACRPCLDALAQHAFARADTLATQYAGLYRSAFLANFLLSAIAVGVALVGVARPTVLGLSAELAIIILIMALTAFANRSGWHERWIDYRHLAEQIRPLRFLFPLALSVPRPQPIRPLDGRERQSSWIEWLSRRVERELGIPNAAVTPAYLAAIKRFVAESILGEQVKYHTANAHDLHSVDHRLHLIGTGLFIATAAACGLDLAAVVGVNLDWGEPFERLHQLGPYLGPLSGVFPAFGAAMLGIRNVGEFARLSKRSKAMAEGLAAARAGLAGEPPESRRHLGARLELIAAQMMSETADWRTLVITRRIEWPG